jgi:integrative and conjugative element protein (TIGR02256 family)
MNQNKNIIISRSVLNLIEKFKQSSKKDNESGGILLGQVTDKEVFILKVTTPNKFDRASRCTFDCNKDAAQIIINYEFLNSGQKTIYIGEWHTHPENHPNPSCVDKEMINNQYFNNKLNEPFLILIIQGLKGLFVAIFDGKKLKETKLTIIEDISQFG